MPELLKLLQDQDCCVEASWKAEAAGEYSVAEAFAALAVHLEREAASVLRKGV